MTTIIMIGEKSTSPESLAMERFSDILIGSMIRREITPNDVFMIDSLMEEGNVY